MEVLSLKDEKEQDKEEDHKYLFHLIAFASTVQTI